MPTWQHWQALQTQWRVGASGATGLDYAGVRAYLALQGLKKSKCQDIFAGLQAAERGTLDAWAQTAKQNKPAG